MDARHGRWRDDMDEQRLIDIEMRIAYQEQTLAELNDVLTDQQAQLTRLQNVAITLGERIQSLAERPESAAEGEQKPPHY